MSETKISIDHTLCIGSGMCALTAPRVFGSDDDGFGELAPDWQSAAGDPMVKEAVRACPVQAIRVDAG
ncbi:ferredoxin [Streptomyces sp. NRRL S-87]|uniref:ferredoxin n=1 Tax=Streptomyces sp. NRRL S-87 TaxID=1463920 RepID=UPI0004C1C2E4|nr:ferredoxin [Streptomyces sp. NRRL S-87]